MLGIKPRVVCLYARPPACKLRHQPTGSFWYLAPLRYLLHQLYLAAVLKEDSIFVPGTQRGLWRLRPGLSFVFFSSHTPCKYSSFGTNVVLTVPQCLSRSWRCFSKGNSDWKQLKLMALTIYIHSHVASGGKQKAMWKVGQCGVLYCSQSQDWASSSLTLTKYNIIIGAQSTKS